MKRITLESTDKKQFYHVFFLSLSRFQWVTLNIITILQHRDDIVNYSIGVLHYLIPYSCSPCVRSIAIMKKNLVIIFFLMQ